MKRKFGARLFCFVGGVALLLGTISVQRVHADEGTVCYGRGPVCAYWVESSCAGNTCTTVEHWQYRN
jgi:hypothetical protein